MKLRFLLMLLLGACATGSEKLIRRQLKWDEIAEIGAKSRIAKYKWPDRGTLPVGYYKGMAVSYAKNLCEPLKNLTTGKGALEFYGLKRNNRELFFLLTVLGPRESSGRYCEGIDKSSRRYKALRDQGIAINAESSMGVEAGMFQTSANAAYVPSANGNKNATLEMKELYNKYSRDKSQCFLEFFKDGVSCSDMRNFGTGEGLTYQKLSKECPIFHIEFSALTILNTKAHHGPLRDREVTLTPLAYEMLDAVEKFVSENGCE